jgi:hypothetical protein
MSKATRYFWFLSVILIMGITGCGTTKAGHSGFLGDYSGLRPSTIAEGAEQYFHPSKAIADYDAFLVAPVRVQFAPGSNATAIDPAKTLELAQYFREKLISELRSGGYSVTDKQGGNALIVRMAITGLKKTNPLLNIHPATKFSGAGLGGASFEGECVDSVTGERIAAVVHSKKGSALSMKAGLSDWDHAKQAMDFWAETFVSNLKR